MKSKFQLTPFFFHENDRRRPWQISADKAVIDLEHGFLAIADGITRTLTKKKRTYPKEFLGIQAAEIFSQMSHFIFKDFNYKKDGMRELLRTVNQELRDFNLSQGYNYDDEKNYDMGECVGACAVIDNDILYYGVLEDCYVNILRGSDLEDQVEMEYQIMRAWKTANEMDEENSELNFEQIWCNKLRNNDEITDKEGNRAGWGCFNGELDSEKFWQMGSVKLKKGDIIWLVTDGMLPVLDSEEISNYIINEANNKGTKSQEEISEMITDYGKQIGEGVNVKTADNIVNEKLEKTLIQIKVE